MTLEEALAFIAAHIGGDDDKATEVREAVRTTIPTLHQSIVNFGVAKGKKEVTPKLAQATSKVEELQAEVDRLAGELETAHKSVPNAETVKTELEAKHARALKAKDDAITALKGHVQRLGKQVGREIAVTQLVASGVEEEWARRVTAADIEGRIVVGDEDASIKVLQLGADDEYDTPDGLDADSKLRESAKKLAGDALKKVPPRYVSTKADAGPDGIRRTGGGAGGGKSEFDAIREKAKQDRERTKPSGSSWEERYGGGARKTAGE
jgi:hypothetical protein